MLNDYREILVEQHGITIKYQNFEKRENLDLVHGLVLQCSRLFPRWLKTLVVVLYDQPAPESPDSEACVNPTNWELGSAKMEIYAKFFDRAEEDQLGIIVHELVHIAHGKILAFDRQYLLDFIENEDERMAEILVRQHTALVEEFTETMGNIIRDLL